MKESYEDAYIKAEGSHLEMKGKGGDLLALFSGIVSNLKYECEMPEEDIRFAVDFGLNHNATKMEEEDEEIEEIKDKAKRKLEEILKLLED